MVSASMAFQNEMAFLGCGSCQQPSSVTSPMPDFPNRLGAVMRFHDLG